MRFKIIKNTDLIVYHHKHARKFPFLCDCSIARWVGDPDVPVLEQALRRGGRVVLERHGEQAQGDRRR